MVGIAQRFAGWVVSLRPAKGDDYRRHWLLSRLRGLFGMHQQHAADAFRLVLDRVQAPPVPEEDGAGNRPRTKVDGADQKGRP